MTVIYSLRQKVICILAGINISWSKEISGERPSPERESNQKEKQARLKKMPKMEAQYGCTVYNRFAVNIDGESLSSRLYDIFWRWLGESHLYTHPSLTHSSLNDYM